MKKLEVLRDGSFDSEKKYETKVLIVDDKDTEFFKAVLNKIKNLSIHPLLATSIDEAYEHLRLNTVSVMVLDKNMGIDSRGKVINGIKYIKKFLAINPSLQIIISTGEGDIKDVVEAIKQGASDFLLKSYDNALMSNRIIKAIKDYQSVIRAIHLKRTPTLKKKIYMGNRSIASNQLVNNLETYARSNRPILLLGEHGTGKTTVAEYLHAKRNDFLSNRNRPFIKVTIPNLPSEEIEGELFGTEKGKYTDVQTTQGLIELANGGTLFLDEIGDLPPILQAKFLEVLQSGTFRRRGGNAIFKSEFRLISATNKNLSLLVKEGEFREDLYYRIAPFSITVPPIRERVKDIPEIIKEMLPYQCRENSVYVSFEDLPTTFINYLKESPPKGNFRGLQTKLDLLLIWSPRDKNGIPNFDNWRETPGLIDKTVEKKPIDNSHCITWEQFIELNLDFIDDASFPGIKDASRVFEAKVFINTEKKFKRKSEIAKALGIHKSGVPMKAQRAKDCFIKFINQKHNPLKEERLK